MTLLLMILAALAAIVLAAHVLRMQATPLAERLDAVLPQTQCRQCGFEGCRPYAEAMAAGQRIDRCPPGGVSVIRRLAHLTGRDVVPLDRSRGEHKAPQVAFIEEDACIGCTLCIQACPVDAIVGAAKRMHTVIAEHCTGCELCLPPCPVDCIALLPRRDARLERLPGARRTRADAARTRYQRRLGRLARERRDHAVRMAVKPLGALDGLDREGEAEARKRAIVQTALERAKARLSAIR